MIGSKYFLKEKINKYKEFLQLYQKCNFFAAKSKMSFLFARDTEQWQIKLFYKDYKGNSGHSNCGLD